MRTVRRIITVDEFIALLFSHDRSAWIENHLLDQADVCGYGFYGYKDMGITGEEHWVEYKLGISCD